MITAAILKQYIASLDQLVSDKKSIEYLTAKTIILKSYNPTKGANPGCKIRDNKTLKKVCEIFYKLGIVIRSEKHNDVTTISIYHSDPPAI